MYLWHLKEYTVGSGQEWRRDGAAVHQQMVKLQDIGLSSFVQVERYDYFYKALPTVVNADTLATFGVSVAEYT